MKFIIENEEDYFIAIELLAHCIGREPINYAHKERLEAGIKMLVEAIAIEDLKSVG